MAPNLFGEVFQIATGVETKLNELAKMIRETAGRNTQIIHEPERKGEIRRNYANITKAKTLLGFVPKVGLREGLAELWRRNSEEIE